MRMQINKKRLYAISLVLFTSVNFLFGQLAPSKVDTDSLKQELELATTEEDQIGILRSLIDAFWNKDAVSGMKYLNILANKIEGDTLSNSEDWAFVWERRGGDYFRRGLLDSAEVAFVGAARYYEKNGKEAKAIRMRVIEGLTFCLRGDYAKAEMVFRREINIAQDSAFWKPRAFAYNQMGTLYHYQNNKDSAILYYDKSIETYGKHLDTMNMLRPMFNSVAILDKMTSDDSALKMYLRIYAIQKRLSSDQDLIHTTNNIIVKYASLNQYEKALSFSLENYEIADRIGDEVSKVSNLINRAKIYQNIKNFDESLRLLKEAENISKQMDNQNVQLKLLQNKSNHYIESKDYVAAIAASNEALDMIDTIDNQEYKVYSLFNSATAHIKLNKLLEAEEISLQGLNLSKKTKDESSIARFNSLLAKVNLNKKNYRKAQSQAQLAYDFGVKTKNFENIADNAKTLAMSYENLNDYKSALKYEKIFKNYADSVLNKENIRIITQKTKDYEFALERKEIETVQAQKELQLNAKNRQTQLIAASIGGFALLLMLFILYSRKKNQQILNQKEQLETLNETKDRIFSIIGHDMRKPALAFRGIAEKVNYLLNEGDYQTLQQFGKQIEGNAIALNKLTDNLLNWALVQKNIMPYHPQEVSVKEEIEQITTFFEGLIVEKSISFQIDIKEKELVLVDKNAFATIIRNLIDNALKFTPKDGVIKISTEQKQNNLLLKIEDNGVGIEENRLKDILLLKKGKSTKGIDGEKGTGLGLHLVSELVKLNKGKISFWSELNKGTSVELNFPAI